MATSTVSYGGFEIVACSEANKRGASVADISLKNSEGKVVDLRPMTIQPEWLTEEEAIRDAVEWGSRFIDREFNAPSSRSCVAERDCAEVRFRDAEAKLQGPEISS